MSPLRGFDIAAAPERIFIDLFPLKSQLPVVGGDFDFIAGLEFAFEQAEGQGIEQMLLHGAFERACAELRVIAFSREILLRTGIHVEG